MGRYLDSEINSARILFQKKHAESSDLNLLKHVSNKQVHNLLEKEAIVRILNLWVDFLVRNQRDQVDPGKAEAEGEGLERISQQLWADTPWSVKRNIPAQYRQPFLFLHFLSAIYLTVHGNLMPIFKAGTYSEKYTLHAISEARGRLNPYYSALSNRGKILRSFFNADVLAALLKNGNALKFHSKNYGDLTSIQKIREHSVKLWNQLPTHVISKFPKEITNPVRGLTDENAHEVFHIILVFYAILNKKSELQARLIPRKPT